MKIMKGCLASMAVLMLGALSARAQFSMRQSAIVNTVKAVGGSIDKNMHDEFWSFASEGERDAFFSKKMNAFQIDMMLLGQEYQRELWRSALLSHKMRSVIITPEFQHAERELLRRGIVEVPLQKDSEDYKAYSVSFYSSFKEGKQRSQEMIQMAADHGTHKTFQGVTVVVDEAYITAILAGVEESFVRLKMLLSPRWEDANGR